MGAHVPCSPSAGRFTPPLEGDEGAHPLQVSGSVDSISNYVTGFYFRAFCFWFCLSRLSGCLFMQVGVPQRVPWKHNGRKKKSDPPVILLFYFILVCGRYPWLEAEAAEGSGHSLDRNTWPPDDDMGRRITWTGPWSELPLKHETQSLHVLYLGAWDSHAGAIGNSTEGSMEEAAPRRISLCAPAAKQLLSIGMPSKEVLDRPPLLMYLFLAHVSIYGRVWN